MNKKNFLYTLLYTVFLTACNSGNGGSSVKLMHYSQESNIEIVESINQDYSGINQDYPGINQEKFYFKNKNYEGFFDGTLKGNNPFAGRTYNLCKNISESNLQCFTGDMISGRNYNGVLTLSGNQIKQYSVKNGGLNNGYPKTQTNMKTPFQKFLNNYEKDKSESNLIKVVLGESGIGNTLSVSQKVDINNDNIRRFFETTLAKNLLLIVKNPETYQHLRLLADNLQTFEIYAMTHNRNNQEVSSQNLLDWEMACNGRYKGSNGTFSQLSLTINRYKKVLQNNRLGLTASQQALIIDLFKIHYLQYRINSSSLYKTTIKSPILDLYNYHSYYLKRGRLDLGFYSIINSHHLGILRNSDVGIPDSEYMDYNKEIYKVGDALRNRLETRSPDRFDMDLLDSYPNMDSDSWLTKNFDNGVSPVVNGLSGSMLSEVRFIVFTKQILSNLKTTAKIRDDLHTVGINKDFLNNTDDVVNFFRIINGLFIYLEGGHSLYEINTIFSLPEVHTALQTVFLNDNFYPSIKSILIDGNKEVVETSINETWEFYQNFEFYHAVTDSLKANDKVGWQ